MPRQSLRARAEAIAAEELGTGRVMIQQAVLHFEDKGLIVVTEEAIEEWKREQARGILERARKYRKKTGEIQLEMINLREVLDDGSQIHYYRRFGELDAREGLILLTYWKKHYDYGAGEFYRYFGPLIKKHGKDLKQLIWFDLPPAPPRSKAS